jgi:hypothetical protein
LIKMGWARADDGLLTRRLSKADHVERIVGGRAFHGALIEWLPGAHPTGLSPPSEQEPATRAYLEVISWRGRDVPVPRLEVQLAVANRRGLTERSQLIRRAQTGRA